MIILLPLLRRLPVHLRLALGSVLTGAGAIAIVVGLLAVSALLLQGIIAVVVGGVFLLSARMSVRRSRGVVAAPRPR